VNKQIAAAFKKHYGEQAFDARRYDYNTFASGWLEARTTERARCAAIVQRHIGYDECGRAAADIYDAIMEE